jgi:hypothetical protein
MQLVHVYLNFPGTTEEAFRYYETVFGTKIAMMQTFGETPFAQNAPESAKKKIMLEFSRGLTERSGRSEGKTVAALTSDLPDLPVQTQSGAHLGGRRRS